MFKILLPTDGSGYSLQAVDYAKKLVGRIQDADITILTVADLSRLPMALMSEQPENASMSLDVSVGMTGIFQQFDNESIKIAKAAQGRLLPCERPVYTRTARGDPQKVICEISEGEKFDLIIMGSTGSGRVAGIFLVSVSNKVLHHSKVPVLIVRGKEEKQAEGQEFVESVEFIEFIIATAC